MKVRTYHNISFDQMSIVVEWELVRKDLLWNYWEGKVITDIPVLDMQLMPYRERTFRWGRSKPTIKYNAQTYWLTDYKGHNLLAERVQ